MNLSVDKVYGAKKFKFTLEKQVGKKWNFKQKKFELIFLFIKANCKDRWSTKAEQKKFRLKIKIKYRL